MNYIYWSIFSIFFLILEILTSSLFFICFSIGSLFTAILSLFFIKNNFFLITFFSFVSVLTMYFLKPLLNAVFNKYKYVKTNVDSLIGEKAVVINKISRFEFGTVKIFGETWIAKSFSEIAAGEIVIIKSISGTVLFVYNIKNNYLEE
ncbi:MAG: NfeD family protein [Endomicrobium sp.]|nr:NfeD family protein [Endomicrobium sp.]